PNVTPPSTSGTACNAVRDYIDSLQSEPPPKRRQRVAPILRDENFVLNDPDIVNALPSSLVPVVVNLDPQVSQPTDDPRTRSDLHVIDTPINAFGVFRRFTRPGNTAMNQHDPEGSTSLSTMSDIRFQMANDAFSPFPNKNTFLLLNWYWNRGAQKSKADFRRLLRIIGSDKFNP
ncbi:hypothetical protein DXG01_015680, partial [Tephrocybe rancida]